MKISTDIDSKYKELELKVCSGDMTGEVRSVVNELHEIFDRNLTGTDEKGNKRILRRSEIFSAYSEGQRVMILTIDGRFVVPQKLYELENELQEADFIRISKSEIVNIRKIRSLDMNITGTIKLVMKNGYETYVSRRNVAKIKERLKKVREENS